MGSISMRREWMKSHFHLLAKRKIKTDSHKRIKPPALQKYFSQNVTLIDLPFPDESVLKENNFFHILTNRRSCRKFSGEPISLNELSLLLWSTQGVQKIFENTMVSIRPVPSAGARHAYETYLFIRNVSGLATGVYRYLSLDHKLLPLYHHEGFDIMLKNALFEQDYVLDSAVVFAWNCIPYRSEWRYGEEAHKLMLIDLGHISQNFYLSAQAMDLGVCAITAYEQKALCRLTKVDGEEEYPVLLSCVGRK